MGRKERGDNFLALFFLSLCIDYVSEGSPLYVLGVWELGRECTATSTTWERERLWFPSRTSGQGAWLPCFHPRNTDIVPRTDTIVVRQTRPYFPRLSLVRFFVFPSLSSTLSIYLSLYTAEESQYDRINKASEYDKLIRFDHRIFGIPGVQHCRRHLEL